MPFFNHHSLTRAHVAVEVPAHLQPHLSSRGFVATELTLLLGAVFGVPSRAAPALSGV